MIYKTLKRFIQGEEASPELFDFCVEALDELVKESEDRKFVESYIRLQILYKLGYVNQAVIPAILHESHLSDIHKYRDDKIAKEIIEMIDHAVENSQL